MATTLALRRQTSAGQVISHLARLSRSAASSIGQGLTTVDLVKV